MSLQLPMVSEERLQDHGCEEHYCGCLGRPVEVWFLLQYDVVLQAGARCRLPEEEQGVANSPAGPKHPLAGQAAGQLELAWKQVVQGVPAWPHLVRLLPVPTPTQRPDHCWQRLHGQSRLGHEPAGPCQSTLAFLFSAWSGHWSWLLLP
jgi:hypothetical protein